MAAVTTVWMVGTGTAIEHASVHRAPTASDAREVQVRIEDFTS